MEGVVGTITKYGGRSSKIIFLLRDILSRLVGVVFMVSAEELEDRGLGCERVQRLAACMGSAATNEGSSVVKLPMMLLKLGERFYFGVCFVGCEVGIL